MRGHRGVAVCVGTGASALFAHTSRLACHAVEACRVRRLCCQNECVGGLQNTLKYQPPDCSHKVLEGGGMQEIRQTVGQCSSVAVLLVPVAPVPPLGSCLGVVVPCCCLNNGRWPSLPGMQLHERVQCRTKSLGRGCVNTWPARARGPWLTGVVVLTTGCTR